MVIFVARKQEKEESGAYSDKCVHEDATQNLPSSEASAFICPFNSLQADTPIHPWGKVSFRKIST